MSLPKNTPAQEHPLVQTPDPPPSVFFRERGQIRCLASPGTGPRIQNDVVGDNEANPGWQIDVVVSNGTNPGLQIDVVVFNGANPGLQIDVVAATGSFPDQIPLPP